MRGAGLMAGGIPLCAACALTVSYDGFEKSSASGDASAGSGGTIGIGGGTFGGTAGIDGSVGATGGAADAATCGDSSECPMEPCVAWSCVSGKCEPSLLSDIKCAPSSCNDTSEAKVSMCVSGVCTVMEQNCGPYTCQNDECLTSCANSLDCVPGLVCNLTQCQQCQHCSAKYDNPASSLAFCEPNSQVLWDALTQCCNDQCIAECTTAAVCGGLGSPSASCSVCLSDGQKCNDAWSACLSDT